MQETMTTACRKRSATVPILLSVLVLAALLATHTIRYQKSSTASRRNSNDRDSSSRLRGVRGLAGTALSIAGGSGLSKSGSIASLAGVNSAAGSANGGGRGTSNSFSISKNGAGYGTAGGLVINNSNTNATTDDQSVADSNATSNTSFKSYGIALFYDNGAFGGYYGFGNAYGGGFGAGNGTAAAASKGSGFGSADNYAGGVAYLGETGALAQGDSLAKGAGSGGGFKPAGQSAFSGGGGGGGSQYGGSFAAFGPRFNDSVYGLPVLPGALGALTRPSNNTNGTMPSGSMGGGFGQMTDDDTNGDDGA